MLEAIGDVAEFDGWAGLGGIVHALAAVRARCPHDSRRDAGATTTSYAFSGRPVMRMPEWPLWRMLRPISSAVICSRMRAFSSLPPSMARTPGIFAASVLTVVGCGGVVAADDHVAIDGSIAAQNVRGSIVERGHHGNTLGHEFGGLLRRRAFPDAESAGGASANAGSQGHRGVNHDAAGADCRLDLLEQGAVAFERDGKHEQIRGGAGGAIFFAGNFCVAADALPGFLPRPPARGLRPAIR